MSLKLVSFASGSSLYFLLSGSILIQSSSLWRLDTSAASSRHLGFTAKAVTLFLAAPAEPLLCNLTDFYLHSLLQKSPGIGSVAWTLVRQLIISETRERTKNKGEMPKQNRSEMFKQKNLDVLRDTE